MHEIGNTCLKIPNMIPSFSGLLFFLHFLYSTIFNKILSYAALNLKTKNNCIYKSGKYVFFKNVKNAFKLISNVISFNMIFLTWFILHRYFSAISSRSVYRPVRPALLM